MSCHPISAYVQGWNSSPFADSDPEAWRAVQQAEALIGNAIRSLDSEYRIEDGFAIHRSAILESGTILKGRGIIGPRCFIAAGAYLRGGTYLAEDCILGPGSELKTSFLFARSKIAHLNFIGDSVIGADVNIEAGAVIANHRNELGDKMIRIQVASEVIETGVDKFGALVGDNVRIGANAVIAPGALIPPGTKVGRLALVDQHPYQI